MSSTRKILVLGAGPVSVTALEYLARDERNDLTIACRTVSNARSWSTRLPRSSALEIDATEPSSLDPHIEAHDVVLALIPPNLHPPIAKSCITFRKHFVCTSFTRPEIADLCQEAERTGTTLITECGVAPGLDHAFAVDKIRQVHGLGGRIETFTSFVGGLAAPECSANPLRTKFSWNPKNTILSQLHSATYLENGNVVGIDGKDLMESARPIDLDERKHDFVGFASGSSIQFKEHYAIPEAHTVIRGTLRYRENPLMIATLSRIGWLDANETIETGITWAQVTQRLLQSPSSDEASLIQLIKQFPQFATRSAEEVDSVIEGLKWIAIFSSEPATSIKASRIDVLCARLEELCSWTPTDRDMVVLQHKFGIVWPEGKKETTTLTMELYGEAGGTSAMARSTGVTCGIVTQMLLDGHEDIARAGLVRPYAPGACRLIKEKLQAEGLTMQERVVSIR